MVDVKYYREAILIRSVEEALLSLFSKGKISGTIHTCVGQELSAVAFGNQLKEQDIVFSNHRCHGHYIAFKKNFESLILELAGKIPSVGETFKLCEFAFRIESADKRRIKKIKITTPLVEKSIED